MYSPPILHLSLTTPFPFFLSRLSFPLTQLSFSSFLPSLCFFSIVSCLSLPSQVHIAWNESGSLSYDMDTVTVRLEPSSAILTPRDSSTSFQ